MRMSNDVLLHLIEQCSARNERALEILYRELAPKLNRYAHTILRCEALSNEVLQESFIQIWESASSFNLAKGQPLTWIYMIVRSRSIDKLRLEQKHTNSCQRVSDDIPIENYSCSEVLEQSISAEQSHQQLECQIDKLQPKVKLAVKLAFRHGLSRNDLAMSLNANVNTVKSWLRRGVNQLKAHSYE